MSKRTLSFAITALLLIGGLGATPRSVAQQASSAPSKPYLVEWVYRVKYGYQDEWWKIFQKYQIATLDREKELGYITNYQLVRPGLHTSEGPSVGDARRRSGEVALPGCGAAQARGEPALGADNESLGSSDSRGRSAQR